MREGIWHAYRPERDDLNELVRLASPIVLVQIGVMLMGVVDTVMVGHLSPVALASVALANLYSFGLIIFGLGVLLALDPVVSQALGARDHAAVERGLQRGLVLSLCLAVPTSLLYLAVEPVLTFVGQPAEVIPYASAYVYRVLPAVWPFFVFVVLRQCLQAHRRTSPIVITIVVANLLNAALNYLWIFGKLGFPPLGVIGSAWATLASRWFMAAMLLGVGWRFLSPYLKRFAPRALALRPLLRMLAIGVPIGGQMALEWGAFATVALLMGWLGVIEVAAHQIALNLASLTFMVPVGVSSAASVIVGHAVGREDPVAVRRASGGALLLVTAFMTVAAIAFIGVPETFARIYTDNTEVVALVVLLLPIAGVFQVFDGTQAVALGLLRGLGDTRIPIVSSIVGFWCLGIPASLLLAFGFDWGAEGLWWGFVVGLGIVAVFLVARVKNREERELKRLHVDEHDSGFGDADLAPTKQEPGREAPG